MNKIYNNRILLVFVALIFGTMCQLLTAQWSTNPAINNAICTATGDQSSPTIISDGSGGAIITWQDYRGGANYDIYAQCINASGTVQWNADGVAICLATSSQSNPTIVGDGIGGAIITWKDDRNLTTDIYAQRINASGTVQWSANGVAICTATGSQEKPTIVRDGSGGAIITWRDSRSGNNDIYAQRINALGTVQWTANGVPICTATGAQQNTTIVNDGTGGAIITWDDLRSGFTSDIYAQRINASGVVQWTTNGVAICTATGTQQNPTIVGDGLGGAIITWEDYRVGVFSDLYAQRINASGNVQWTANGVTISTASNDQISPTIASDGAGGAIITWEDYLNYTTTGDDIYTQRINASGSVQWTANGIAICTVKGDQYIPTIVGDGTGGAIITWNDTRNFNTDIYAQRINALGTLQWPANGIAISTTASGVKYYPTIVNDGTEGAIITWKDFRSGTNYDIFAQKIDKYGVLGQAAPKLIAAKDIANDQGGRLRLFWDPSYLDAEAYQKIKSYTILLGARTTGILGKSSGAQASGIYWQEAAFISAKWLEGYTTVIPTYADSGLQGTPMYYFQVIAKNSDSTQMWYSNIDSGYSVDNIPPVGLGNALIASNGRFVFLKWNKNRVDKDLMEYRIYRSTTPGFAIGTSTKLKATTDTTYTDSTGTNGATYYYRLAAVDVHGNIGAPSAELNQKVLTVQGIRGVAPKEFTLEQNYPNPFNPTTTIEFTVPSNGRATLKVFNALGEEVATLFNGKAEAGRYNQVQFNAANLASGIYFARLVSDGKSQAKKLILMK